MLEAQNTLAMLPDAVLLLAGATERSCNAPGRRFPLIERTGRFNATPPYSSYSVPNTIAC